MLLNCGKTAMDQSYHKGLSSSKTELLYVKEGFNHCLTWLRLMFKYKIISVMTNV
jgi:hypothetical protein